MNDAPYDIILSGPIAGVPDYVQRFAIAYVVERQKFRTDTGREANVFNPAALQGGFSNEWYMRKCVAAIFDSHHAVLVQLHGWDNDKRAVAEYAACLALGRVIREQCSNAHTRPELSTKYSTRQVSKLEEVVSG